MCCFFLMQLEKDHGGAHADQPLVTLGSSYDLWYRLRNAVGPSEILADHMVRRFARTFSSLDPAKASRST